MAIWRLAVGRRVWPASWVCAIFLLAASAVAEPEVSTRFEHSELILEVQPETGPAWSRSFPYWKNLWGGWPTILRTQDFFAVADGDVLRTTIVSCDWTGKRLPSVVLDFRLPWFWISGSQIVGLEDQHKSFFRGLSPGLGSDLWSFTPGDSIMREVDLAQADQVLTDAPVQVAFDWYARRGQRPPRDYATADLGFFEKRGFAAAYGDLEARDEIVLSFLEDEEFNPNFAQSIALSGPDVLRPLLIEKAHRMAARAYPEDRGFDAKELDFELWGMALESLRDEFRSLPLESLPGLALKHLPSRAAWENQDRLLRMAAAGNASAMEALCSACGPWDLELPAKLLALPGAPPRRLVEILGYRQVYPGTLPLLMEKLDDQELTFQALRTQSGVDLPSDSALWRVWWRTWGKSIAPRSRDHRTLLGDFGRSADLPRFAELEIQE